MTKNTPALILICILILAIPMCANYNNVFNNQKKQNKEETLAFPTAEGFGRYAKGGRGGDVYYVTNLHDSGPGSLRYGLKSANGRRTILFSVSGIIKLESALEIKKPYITVAGQTAPGDGICIKNYSTNIINTHDVIIRHLRFRPGDQVGHEKVSKGAEGWTTDALWIGGGSNNIIIDHCSTSWGNDEILSATQAFLDNITIQWTLITESLNNSTHPKGKHGYGSILGGYASGTQPRITVHHSLFAHNWARNPNFAGDRKGNPPGSVIDFRNNTIYNWGKLAAHNYSPQYTHVNFVNNYLKPGPSTNQDQMTIGLTAGSKNMHIYAAGNRLVGFPESDGNNWLFVQAKNGVTSLEAPVPVPVIETQSAHTAYLKVINKAGAFPRDAVDNRVILEIKNGSGRIIDSPHDVGGWPDYSSESPPADNDGDGMPDSWEEDIGLDPKKPHDGNIINEDGFTNLEKYLQWKHEKVMVAQQ